MATREMIAMIYHGIRVGIRSWIALQQGKRYANKGVQIFKNALYQQGLTEEIINVLTITYQANLDFLSIRKLSRFAIQLTRQSSNS